MSGNDNTFVVGICGLDGAGKSTCVRTIEEERLIAGAVCVRKQNRRAAELVERYHRRSVDRSADYVVGEFAYALGLASSLDFLEHYNANIEPLLGRADVIICDRYFLCYHAYLVATGFPVDVSCLFHNVRTLDLAVYLDVSVDVALQRCGGRGGLSEHETPEVMKRFAAAYGALLPNCGCPVVTVSNNGKLRQGLQEIVRAIQSHLAKRT